jgi:tRNA pseudouridine55 synthase
MSFGWIIIDKEEGQPSMGVTSRVKRLFGVGRAGHAGTLDPLATGILPIALGQATRLIPFLMSFPKTYQFTVEWGKATTTDDGMGTVCGTSSSLPEASSIEEILPLFTGDLTQIPPRYSAAKIEGIPAYTRARRGESFTLVPRSIHVFSLHVLLHQGERTTFEIQCSSGTYVRSIARDMAEALGTYGHVISLRRSQVGCFTGGYRVNFLEGIEYGEREALVLPPQRVLLDLPGYILTQEEKGVLWKGGGIFPSFPEGTCGRMRGGESVSCYDSSGLLVALCTYSEGKLFPSHCFIGEL